MVVLAGVTEVLRQVALPNDYYTDPGYLFEHVREVFDRSDLFAHYCNQDFALRIERPYIGARIILGLGEPPIACGGGRCITALSRRFKIRGSARAWVSACCNGIARLFNSAHMGPYNSINTLIKYLFGDPLADFTAIGGNAHKRRYLRRQGAGSQYLPPIEHELQAISQRADIIGPMLHLEYHAIIRSS